MTISDARALDHMDEHDLTQRVSVTSANEIGQMGLAFNGTIEAA